MLSFELGLHVILANASIYVALQTDLSLRWDNGLLSISSQQRVLTYHPDREF